MNIHPLFVHFPIGLLVLYAILELLPLAQWYPQAPWTAIKTVLSLTGAMGAVVAVGTGDIAKEVWGDTGAHDLIEVHEKFGVMTTFIFGVLAYSYVVRWVSANHKIFEGKLHSFAFLGSIADIIARRWIMILLALGGLIAITITGGLGAAIVYGPYADPVVTIIYSLFVQE